MAKFVVYSEVQDGTTFYYSSGGVRQGHSFKKWYTCDICSEPQPEDRFLVYRGKYYGKDCGCYKDIVNRRE